MFCNNDDLVKQTHIHDKEESQDIQISSKEVHWVWMMAGLNTAW